MHPKDGPKTVGDVSRDCRHPSSCPGWKEAIIAAMEANQVKVRFYNGKPHATSTLIDDCL